MWRRATANRGGASTGDTPPRRLLPFAGHPSHAVIVVVSTLGGGPPYGGAKDPVADQSTSAHPHFTATTVSATRRPTEPAASSETRAPE